MARRTVGNLVVNVLLNAAKFESGLRRMERSLNRQGRRLQSIGRNMTTGLTLPLAAAGIAAGKMAVDFDDSLTKIVGLVGVAREQVDAWRGDLLKLAKETGKGPSELADGLFFVTSAGARGAEALDILRKSAKAAAAGLGSTANVADAVTSAMNAYGPANLSAAKATGILVAAVREGKAGAEELAPVLGRIIPIAAELGVGFDQVGAAMAVMTRISGSATQSATALRGILAKLIKPTEMAKKELKAVGLSMGDVQKSLVEKGLLRTLINLRQTFEGNSEALGRIFEDVEALNGVLILTGKNASSAEKIFASLSKETGQSLVKAFDAVRQSAGFKFRKALAQIQVIMIRLGATIIPQVLPLLEKMAVLAGIVSSAFFNLSPALRNTILALTGLVGIAGPVIAVIGFIISAVAGMVSPFFVAAAAMAAAGLFILKRWEKVRDGLKIIWDEMAKAARIVFEVSMKSKLGGAMRAVHSEIVGLSKDMSEKVFGAFERMGKGSTGASSAIGRMGPKIEAALAPVIGAAGALKDAYVLGFKEMLLEIQNFAVSLGVPAEKVKQKMEELATKAAELEAAIKKLTDETGGKISAWRELVTSDEKLINSSFKSLTLGAANTLGSITAELLKGKKSFKEWALAAVGAIVKVMLQLAVISAFGPLGGAFASGLLGGLIPRARGGRLGVGDLGLVGERGPEFFTPDTSGTVTPLSEVGIQGPAGMSFTIPITVQGFDFGNRETARSMMRSLGEEVKRKTKDAIMMSRRFQDVANENLRRAV